MKKTSKALLLLASSLVLGMASCGSSSNGPKEVPYSEENSVKTDSVYLGLLEKKEYTPDSRLDFTVTLSDTSLATYEDGAFQSLFKEGTLTATFVSASVTYEVSVTVAKDGTVPLFELEAQDLSVYNGTTYVLNTSLSYRGVDVNDYEHTLKVTKETNQGTSSIEVDGTSLKIKGDSVGSDTYTVFTEFAGFTLSKTLEVNVKNNEGLVICGKNLVYDNLGPHYTISMYKYSENPISLKDDIRVLKGGKSVAFSDLSISFSDPSILSLDGEKLLPHKSGKTSFTVSASGESIEVSAEIYKPVMNDYAIEVAEQRFDLDMSVTSTSSSRTFESNKANNKKIAIPSNGDYQEIAKLVVNEKEIDFASSSASYSSSDRQVSLNASLFTIENYGKQSVSVYLEAADYTDVYTFTLDFVTKYITTYSQMSEYFTQKYAKDAIYGQYVLANDLDGEGKEATAAYVSLGTVNYAYGFRGIFDGDGHSIKNYKSSLFGFFIVIGNGAIVRNVNFTDIHYQVKESGGNRGLAVLGRFLSGATFDNLTFTLADDSVTSNEAAVGGKTDSTGILCTEIFTYNTVRNLTINAQGFELASVFGKNISSTTFYNVSIYCKSLSYIGSDQSKLDGVAIIEA